MQFFRDKNIVTVEPWMERALRERFQSYSPEATRNFFSQATHRDPRTLWKRRSFLVLSLAAAIAWVIGAPYLSNLWRPALEVRDLPGLAPFRALEPSAGLSTTAGLLVGLEAPTQTDPLQEARVAAVRADPCTALFGGLADPRLPIAFFSDFNGPNCQLLNVTL